MQDLNKIKTEEDLEAAIAAETLEAEEAPVVEASVEQLPISIIREKLDAKGIVYKSTDKKPALIKALLSGETTIKEVVKKAAPRMEDKITPQALPILSETLKAELDKLVTKGLVYDLDTESSCLNFSGFGGRLTACANIDQPTNNILSAARSVVGKISFGAETNDAKAPFINLG